ncbi:MAG: tRNA uridine-5-carboxymethylaminomethyl(34) synthesis GTPase MnmE [Clostridia bacterium]|nr:tRNA uridine-5-carboxymethylaminomethyl(34) synthesis GTPase MnmE [Clostridia bacterium]
MPDALYYTINVVNKVNTTIAAVSTPNAAGGIGIIRISGENAVGIADRCFKNISGKSLSSMPGYRAAYGSFFDESGDIDDGVAVIYRAPKSYTGEDVAELCCHGGLFVTQKILRLVYSLGAVPAEPGEFTKRAFLNGKMDLSQAESVMKVISAQGESALKAARNTLSGNVSKKVNAVCSQLVSCSAALAAWADYPDEDIPAVENKKLGETLEDVRLSLQKLIKDYDAGRSVTEGVNTVICGKPNAGKSTLMNLLTGYERSIVTNVPGTTRDSVEETVRVGDIVLRLSDTAGIRNSSDLVESIGVEIAKNKIENSDLVIAVFDSSEELSKEDIELIELCKNKTCLAVINKSDLPCAADVEKIENSFTHHIVISAKTDDDTDKIRSALESILGAGGLDFSGEILAGERQRRCCGNALTYVENALSALGAGLTVDAVNVDIDCAIDELLTLTGKKASEEVVSEVFRSFCVGK